MVTRDEIEVALHQDGLEQGREEEAARKLVEFVALYWDKDMGQAFQERLAHWDASFWPALRDLRAAYEEGRDPCALLISPAPRTNGRPITWDEMKKSIREDGYRIGFKQGLIQGLIKAGEARKLVEFVALFWDEDTGQAFQARLTNRDARVWPALRDLRAAYEEGRDPCALLDASGTSPTPGANDRPSAVT